MPDKWHKWFKTIFVQISKDAACELDKWHKWFTTIFVQISKDAACELNMIFSFAFAE